MHPARTAVIAGLAVAAVLLVPAAALLQYSLLDRPLPVAELPLLARPVDAAIAVDSIPAEIAFLERAILQSALHLIPDSWVVNAGACRSPWTVQLYPSQRRRSRSDQFRKPLLIAHRGREAKVTPGCAPSNTLLVRLMVQSSSGDSAAVVLDWLVFADEARRGRSLLRLSHDRDGWRLDEFREMSSPPPPKDEAELLSQFYGVTRPPLSGSSGSLLKAR